MLSGSKQFQQFFTITKGLIDLPTTSLTSQNLLLPVINNPLKCYHKKN
jgi:hypothetical protein